MPVCIDVLVVFSILFFQPFVINAEDVVAFIDTTVFQAGKGLWSTQIAEAKRKPS